MHLVIIEAPGKLKKLRSLLPSIRPDVTWHVEATAGHIRDLPVHGQNPQMPTVGVGQDFKPHYQILSGKEKTVARLKEPAAESRGSLRRIRPGSGRRKHRLAHTPGCRDQELQARCLQGNHQVVHQRRTQARRVAWTSRRSPRRNAVASSIAWWGIWSRQSCGA